jgi:hypothetical protein
MQDTISQEELTDYPLKIIILPRGHSRMLLAGIQMGSLHARLRGHDEWKLDTHVCGAVLSMASPNGAMGFSEMETRNENGQG